MAAAVVLGACGGEGVGFGPLAVIGPASGGASDSLGGTGTLSIEDSCVYLDLSSGDRILLVWHSDQVRWNADRQEIEFGSTATEPAVIIGTGDTLTVGGESLSGGEYGNDTMTQDLAWVAEPDTTCVGELFAVDSMSPG